MPFYQILMSYGNLDKYKKERIIFVIDRNIIITVHVLHKYHFLRLQNLTTIIHVSFEKWNKVLSNNFIIPFSSTI